jgi:hypothetical protein
MPGRFTVPCCEITCETAPNWEELVYVDEAVSKEELADADSEVIVGSGDA